MKRMTTLWLGIALTLSTFASVQAETLKLTNGEWPPFLSEKYKHYGLASHIVSEAMKQQGVSVEYGFFPWKRALTLAEKGSEWHGSVVWGEKDERKVKFLYSEPVIVLNDVFFYPKDKPIKWEKLEDLKGIRIGASIGYSYGAEFDNFEKDKTLNIIRAKDEVINLKKISDGKLEAFPCTLEVCIEILNTQLTDIKDKVGYTDKELRSTSYHLLVSKSAPNAEAMIDKFNKGLAAIKESGQYDEFIKSNLSGGYAP